jgi:elongation factor G
VLCGSAFKNKGVQPMLDAVVDYLPSPLDVPAIGHAPGKEDVEVIRKPTSTSRSRRWPSRSPHPFFGADLHPRLLRHLDSGAQVINSTKGKKERIGKLFQMHANKENPVETATAGHIYAVIGLKDTTTGDTLCDPKRPGRPRVDDLPGPGHRGRHRAEDQGRPGEAGHRDPEARRRGPDLPVQLDQETGQTVIGGMGELHLDILVDRMRASSRSRPTSASRRSPTARHQARRREVDYTHKKQTGGSGQFAKVIIASSRSRRDGGTYEFENKVTGGRIPREYIPSVDAGAQDAMQYGVLAGYPLVGRQGHLLDGVPRRRLVGDGLQDRRLAGQGGRRRRNPSSSSRSWPSRSPRPRTTWATSSAT